MRSSARSLLHFRISLSWIRWPTIVSARASPDAAEVMRPAPVTAGARGCVAERPGLLFSAEHARRAAISDDGAARRRAVASRGAASTRTSDLAEIPTRRWIPRITLRCAASRVVPLSFFTRQLRFVPCALDPRPQFFRTAATSCAVPPMLLTAMDETASRRRPAGSIPS